MSESVVFRDQFAVNLGKGTYQWVSIKRFLVGSDCTETEILSALVNHIEYRDLYLGPNEDHALEIHGPYNLSDVQASDFIKLSQADALRMVRDYTYLYRAPDAAISDLESRLIAPIERSPIIWRLSDLGDEAKAEGIGTILRDFEELVVYDKMVGELLLVVMAGD